VSVDTEPEHDFFVVKTKLTRGAIPTILLSQARFTCSSNAATGFVVILQIKRHDVCCIGTRIFVQLGGVAEEWPESSLAMIFNFIPASGTSFPVVKVNQIEIR
jgi:hypothetical protein